MNFLSLFVYIIFSSSIFGQDATVQRSKKEELVYRFNLKNPYTIILKKCMIDSNKKSVRSKKGNDCKENKNAIPIKVFKKILRGNFNLKLFSFPIDIENKQVQLELVRLNSLFRLSSKSNYIVSVDQLKKASKTESESKDFYENLKKKMDDMIEYLASNPQVLSEKKYEKSFFVQDLLKRFDPDRNKICGLVGSIRERIKDCGSYSYRKFSLVSRNKDFLEIFYDELSGLLWTGRYSKKLSYIDAAFFCKNLGKRTGLSDVVWYLPAIEDFQYGESRKFRQVLRDIDYFFWSSSDGRKNVDARKIFNGNNGSFTVQEMFDKSFNNRFYSLLCVGR